MVGKPMRHAALLSLQFPGMQLAAAQQYCLVTAGYAPLHAWVKRHMARMHTVPHGHDIIMTSGNNQTIEVGCQRCIRSLCFPPRRLVHLPASCLGVHFRRTWRLGCQPLLSNDML